MDENNTEALLALINWLKDLHAAHESLVGMIYLQSIQNKTISSTAAKTVHILKKICGVQTFGNIFVTTVMWSRVSLSDGISREMHFCQRNDLWAPMIAAGSTLCQFAENRDEAEDIVKKLLRKPPVVLQLQEEVAVLQKPIEDTKAGATILNYVKIAQQRKEDKKFKQHLLNPDAYFSQMQRLEEKVARDCRIQELFPALPDGYLPVQDAGIFAAIRKYEGSIISPLVVPPESLRDSTPKLCLNSLVSLQSIIEGVLRCFRRLQEHRFCGESFSIMAASQDRKRVVEVIPISVTVLQHLARLVGEAIVFAQIGLPNDCAPPLQSLEHASNRTLNHLGFPSKIAKHEGLQRTTKLFLLLSLGLVSYAGSHASNFHTCYFGTSNPCTFDIAQCGDIDGGISLRQEKLACLDKFVGGPIWVFRPTVDRLVGELTQTLSTSLRDLADLWGPAWVAECDEQSDLIHHVTVERGIIYQSCTMDSFKTLNLREDEIVCHWRSWDEIETASWNIIPFSEDDQMLIGTQPLEGDIHVNKDCPIEDELLYKEFNRMNRNFILGTEHEKYQLDVQTLSLQFSKIVNVGYQAGFKRMPGRTWKSMMLLEWSDERPSPSTLDVLLGLEISACTGNSRRAKLWDIFNLPGVQDFIKITMPDDLPGSDSPFPSFLDSFAKGFGRFQKRWVASSEFRKAARQIIRKVLQCLSYTGVDKDGWLRAWWADGKALRGFRINPKQHRWVAMLQDTERTAVFAVVSTTCIEFLGPRRYPAICSSRTKLKGGTVLRTAIVLDPEFTRKEKGPRKSLNKSSIRDFRTDNDQRINTVVANPSLGMLRVQQLGWVAILRQLSTPAEDGIKTQFNKVEQPKTARRRMNALEDELSQLGTHVIFEDSSKTFEQGSTHSKLRTSETRDLRASPEPSSQRAALSTSYIDSDSSNCRPNSNKAFQKVPQVRNSPLQNRQHNSLLNTRPKPYPWNCAPYFNCENCKRRFFSNEHNPKSCYMCPQQPSDTSRPIEKTKGQRGVLANGETVQLLNSTELTVRSEGFPQLVELKSKGAMHSFDGFMTKLLKEGVPVHREYLCEDVEEESIFHVAVI